MHRRPGEPRRLSHRRQNNFVSFILLGIFVLLLYLSVHPSNLHLIETFRDGRLLFGKQAEPLRSKEAAAFAAQAAKAATVPDLALRLGVNYTTEMLDPHSAGRQLRDQMALAKGFLFLGRESGNFALVWELEKELQAARLLLSKAATRGHPMTGIEARDVMARLALLNFRARELHYDSATALERMKHQVVTAEEKASAASAQAAYFGQLLAESIPKALQCLGMLLTAEWAGRPELRSQADSWRQSPKLVDKSLFHFCVFSDNVLAVAVVVASAVRSSPHKGRLVFHVVTEHASFAAMQAWFATHPPEGGATVDVEDIASFGWLNASYAPVLKQLQGAEVQSYYFQGSDVQEPKSVFKFKNPKYLNMLNHLRFYLPDIYPRLDKIVFLDDDIVVQKDLSPLFSLDLHGNVNGAVETCRESFHRFHKYVNFSHPLIRDAFDPDACGWAFGMNVFDLAAWKRAGVTQTYHAWQERNADRTLWKLGTLPPGLLTFYGITQPIDGSWHVLGLGYDASVSTQAIEAAAVIHWNGNMKPWLKLGMRKYKPYWDRHVPFADRFIQECNVR